jgi:hypothetical protein
MIECSIGWSKKILWSTYVPEKKVVSLGFLAPSGPDGDGGTRHWRTLELPR